MDRFGRKNLLLPVSLTQFQDTGSKLVENLRGVRDDLDVIMRLTTNENYYNGLGSLTILDEFTEEAAKEPENQPMKIPLDEITKDQWDRAYSRDLSIYTKDDTPYMITMANEVRDDKRLLFYGQALDIESQEVFMALKKRDRLLQTLDDGFPVTSDFSAAYAMATLR